MTPFHREQYEDRQYPVSGRNLRGYKGAFERAGYPVQIAPSAAPGIYIMIVTLPQSMPQEIDPYSLPARHRQAWPRFDARGAIRTAAILAIVVAVAYIGWQIFAAAQPAGPTLAGAPVEHGGMALAADGSMAQDDGGWLAGIRWPWQDAQDAAQDVAESVQSAERIISIGAGALPWLLALLLAAVVFIIARRVLGKGGQS